MPPPPRALKDSLRRRLRESRRSLSGRDHAARSERAAHVITRLAEFRAGARVAIYLPFDGETDTSALTVAARRRGVRLFAPVVSDLRHRRLRFYPLSRKTMRGTFGIRVPRLRGTATPARWFDLIVVPLVGIDTAGRRLGMGGGFYDRAFSFRRVRCCWRGPRLVGLGFDRQCVVSVHAEAWDMRLDSLATESGLHTFHASNP